MIDTAIIISTIYVIISFTVLIFLSCIKDSYHESNDMNDEHQILDYMITDCIESNGFHTIKQTNGRIKYLIETFDAIHLKYDELTEFNFDQLDNTLIIITDIDSDSDYKCIFNLINEKITAGCVVFGGIFDEPELPCTTRQIITMVEEYYSEIEGERVYWDDIDGLSNISIKPSYLKSLLSESTLGNIKHNLDNYYTKDMIETFVDLSHSSHSSHSSIDSLSHSSPN